MERSEIMDFHTERIEKTIEIHASAEHVWLAITEPQHLNQWIQTFKAGSKIKMLKDDKVAFYDQEKNGICGKIQVRKANQELAIQFISLIKNGENETNSDEARRWTGCSENFYINEGASGCILTVEEEVPDSEAKKLSKKWDEAVRQIKELSEELAGTRGAAAQL